MQIKHPPYVVSEVVENYSQVEHLVPELHKTLADLNNPSAVALHHAQVQYDKPWNIFVVRPEMAPVFGGSDVIINPKRPILDEKRMYIGKEGCLSFPHKAGKNVLRSFAVIATFSIPSRGSPNGLLEITKELTSIPAKIYQHETDHGLGKNIYYGEQKKY